MPDEPMMVQVYYPFEKDLFHMHSGTTVIVVLLCFNFGYTDPLPFALSETGINITINFKPS